MKKLTIFTTPDAIYPVSFVETQEVKEGVEYDVYAFTEDSSRDLTIVKVIQDYRTPLQRVVGGGETIEGFVEGEGTLSIESVEGKVTTYHFTEESTSVPITIHVGERMQWHADGHTDLIFYILCEPSYEKGRFEDMPGNL